MSEILARGWADLLGRLDGPLHFRLIVQPLVAMLLGARAGLRDSRSSEPPFLWQIVRCPERRRERAMDGLRDVASLLVVATLLDAAYQLVVYRGIYLVELLIVVALLAVVPYALVRGPVTRFARLTARGAANRVDRGASPP